MESGMRRAITGPDEQESESRERPLTLPVYVQRVILAGREALGCGHRRPGALSQVCGRSGKKAVGRRHRQ